MGFGNWGIRARIATGMVVMRLLALLGIHGARRHIADIIGAVDGMACQTKVLALTSPANERVQVAPPFKRATRHMT
ncbi:MAG: hypothetical protein K2W33_17060 [Burkholderiales bacterium]|jgi:hypothetical protein|nr:hypothetical protein [Burkholderiales bacterium]